MRINKILVVAATILSVQIIAIDGLGNGKCAGMDITITDEQKAVIKDCAKSLGFKSTEPMQKQINCLAKCILEKKNLVDADGKPHKENILKAVDAAMPEAVKAEFKTRMEKCLDDFVTYLGSNPPKTDQLCTSYSPLAVCAKDAFKDICMS